MSLLNRLRPKWQNSDPEVRAEAVRQLDKDDVELLLAVAQQDEDPRVRRIAVKKLESPRPLLEIAATDEDLSLRAYARERARHLLVQIACDDRDVEESRRALSLLDDVEDRVSVADRAHFAEIRSAAYQGLSGDAELALFVRKSRDPERRSQALEHIGDPRALKSIVVDEAAGDLASVALARIDDLSLLESILELHTLSRALRRQAESRLWDRAPDDHPLKRGARRERYESLCRAAEELVERTPLGTVADGEEVSALGRAWSEVENGGPPDDELRERFQAALGSLRTEKKTTPIEEPEPAAPQPPATEPEDARWAALVEQLGSLADDALSEGLAAARQERTGLGELDRKALQRLDDAFRQAEARLERLERTRETAKKLAELVTQAEETLESMELLEAERDWRAIERMFLATGDAVDEALRERYTKLAAKLEERRDARAREERANHEELERRVAKLQELAGEDPIKIKEAARELREAQEFLKTMGPLPRDVHRKKARRRLMDARESLFKRTQDTRELEDWKRWANVDIQEALIQRVEKLRDSRDLPKVAKELRVIHEEWKQAGSAPAEKAEELWQRYKAVRDELKARCDAFFEKQNRERAENLAKKEALCAEVESLKDSEDWNKTAERIKELQSAWRKIGPAPAETSDAVWKRFRAACDQFFERRKEHFGELKGQREENLKKKVALCEQAEAVKESTDWNKTGAVLKRLQSEWRTIGPVPHRKSDAVWKRFRAACDYFFDRSKRRDEIESEERAKERLAVVEELDALPEDLAGEALREPALAIWDKWKKLGRRPEVSPELVERFETKMGEVVSRAPEQFRGTELDPASSRKRRAKIVERLETIVGELEGKTPGAEPLEDLAARLKDALARNTMTGGKGRDRRPDWTVARDEVTRLRSSWTRTAPISGEDARELAERFERAYQSFRDLRPDARSAARS